MGAIVVDAYYTNEDGDQDFQNPTGNNWRLQSDDSVLGAGNYPGDGSTLDSNINGPGTATNRPNAGETFHFDCRQVGVFGDSELINSGAVVGNVDVSSGQFYSTLPITGNLDMTGGNFTIDDNVTVSGTASATGGTISTSGAYALDLTSILTGSNFTIDWGSGDLDIFGGINATTVTHSNTASGNVLTHNVAGTLSLGGSAVGLQILITANTTIATAVTCYGYERSGGTVTFTGVPTITVGAGGCIYAATPTGTFNLTFTANANLRNNRGNNKCVLLTIPTGVTATIIAESGATALSGGGTISIGTSTFWLVLSIAGWLTGWTGLLTTSTGFIYVFPSSSDYDPLGDIRLTTTDSGYIKVQTTTNKTLSWTGNIDVSEFRIYATTAGNLMTINITSDKNLTVTGTLKLGNTAATTGGGVLSTNGLVKIGSLALGNAANRNGAWAVNSSYIECSGVMNGTEIAFTDTSGTCHILGLGTGTIQSVTTDNLIHAHDFNTYGVNTNVTEDYYAYPQSGALMGCGI